MALLQAGETVTSAAGSGGVRCASTPPAAGWMTCSSRCSASP
ncbi:hypothetical protein NKG94_23805 [Micromonospora sp. M12]